MGPPPPPPSLPTTKSPSTSRGAIAALLAKNWTIKRRHPFATLSELLNPLLCILFFAALKTLEPDLEIPSGWATAEKNKTHRGFGSSWGLYEDYDLLASLNASLQSAGLSLNASALGPPVSANGTASSASLASSSLSLLSLASALRIPRFYFSETTMPGLLLNLALQSLLEGDNLQELGDTDLLNCFFKFGLLGYTSVQRPATIYAVPDDCRGRVVPYKLAITPDTAFTRHYVSAMLEYWYPRLPLVAPVLGISPLTMPSFADSRVFFADDDALDAYIASEDYGRNLSFPKIYAAISFHSFPNDSAAIGQIPNANNDDSPSLAFALRFNSTYTDTSFPNSVPRAGASRRDRVDRLLRTIAAGNTQSYATRGFMTLQTAVMRVLNCLPPWDPTTDSIRDPGVCQLPHSTMRAEPTGDRRLLRQLEDDMIVGTVLSALSSLRRTLAEAGEEAIPENLRGFFRAVQTLVLTTDGIPASTQTSLLRSLRQAPQAFHGAGVFVSPVRGFHYAGFYDKILVVFPVFFILSSLYGISRVIVALLMEKETRSREFQRILGLRDRELLVSWFVTYVLLFLVATGLQTFGSKWLLFPQSSVGLLWLFFFSFALSCWAYGFLVSTIFQRARAGSFMGMGGFFLLFFVSYAFPESASEGVKTWSGLLAPVAFAQGITIVAHFESIEIGLTTANASELVNGFRFHSAIILQVVDFGLYTLLGMYLEQVLPKEYGVVSEKWYFPISPTYWRRQLYGRPRDSDGPGSRVMADMVGGDEALGQEDAQDHETQAALASPGFTDNDGGHCEPVSAELQQQERDGRAIVISRLRKVFRVPGRGRPLKVAVRGLSLRLYEGQVTCLLGHNGAGKTTLLSMLTGMLPPTSGDARIGGRSIRTDLAGIRRALGYCPQASVLYPELTVEEHLSFYARVKGTIDVPRAVTAKLEEVGLTEKRRVVAGALSGGMQRKLALAIAFLGDNRVVILDEPTSGMDPYSRRSTWELIQAQKRRRVVILTTHFMDEADLLGDRIAILADGELRCVGSSLFLKNRFGVGYRLRVILGANTDNNHGQGIRELVRRRVPSARLATDVGTERSFQLPFESSGAFPGLFEELELRQRELGVQSYGISVTTLEEIFLKVAEDHHHHHQQQQQRNDDSPSIPAPMETTTTAAATGDVSGSLQVKHIDVATPSTTATTHTTTKMKEAAPLQSRPVGHAPQHSRLRWFAIHVGALFRKRVLCARRDRSMVVYSTVLPSVILFAGLTALKFSLFLQNDPRVWLVPDEQFDHGDAAASTLLRVPVACVHAASADPVAPESAWCEAITDPVGWAEAEARPERIDVEPVVFGGSSSPTVFGIPYANTTRTIEPNDTSGYCLRFGERVFERAYGLDTPSTNDLSTTVGPFGGILLEADNASRVLAYNVLANSSALHAAPLHKALIDEAIHRFLVWQLNATARPGRVRVATHPFPLSFKSRSIFGAFLSLPAVLFVVIAFTFIPAAMMPYLIREKHPGQNARHQQLLAGVSLPAYWLANLAFDLLVYALPMAIALGLLRSFRVSSSFSSSDAAACDNCTRDVPAAIGVLFGLFGTAIAPWTYLVSHVFRDPGACLLYTVMLNFGVGLVLLLGSYSLDSLESTRAANAVLVFVWRLSPLFSLGNGLLRVILADIQALFGLSAGRGPTSAFDPSVAGNEIAYLAIEGPIFFALAVGIDFLRTGEWTVCGRDLRDLFERGRRRWQGLCHRGRQHVRDSNDGAIATEDEDEDVRTEARRVLLGPAMTTTDEDIVRILRLHKTYANGKRAVANISFGLARGDCFGFLGINGAGKTTTMQILTGNVFPSYGTARLNGFDILTQRAQVRRSIGYCPQFDALLDLMTVREHLQLYGRLKGYTGRELATEVERLITRFQLSAFTTKLAGSLSGGNKRKLSVAIAMLGDPALLFLDEPSTGMDPFSRRFMWDLLLEVSVRGRRSTIVLTTHSMEECEALCNRAGIMVGGRLRCFGTIPHLKTRFGDGYFLDCKLDAPAKHEVQNLIGTIHGHLPAPKMEITATELPALCEALGHAERAEWILSTTSSHPTGNALREQLDRSEGLGALDVSEFASWWLLEDRVRRLSGALTSAFAAGGVTLVERQPEFCRFQITHPGLPLSGMFRVVETAREALGVREYSLAPTSLEQIFNAFARQQREEQGVARSFWPGANG